LQQESAAVAVHGPAATESAFTFTSSGAAFEAVDIPVGLAPVRALRSGRALREQLLAADLVHAHGLRAGVLAARARRKLRSREPWSFVATWHNVPQSARPFAALQHRMEAQLAHAADVSLAVSPDLVERVR